MAWYCYWISQKQEVWNLILATERAAIAASGKAEFITALDIDSDLDSDPDPTKAHYRGDFYVDFDAEDIDESIEKTREFLSHLVDAYGIDPEQLRLFASGKKGFHIEVPTACFIGKPNPNGYLHLPAIYKEMAFSMYHETLDLSVYTARKGRMWRVVNFKRPDSGTYKIQITAAEALGMTEALYRELVAAPRVPFLTAPPSVSSKLELLWTQCRDKVERKVKRNAGKKRDANLLAKFNNQIPPTLEALMNGDGIKEGAGFQKIALQLAIAAHGLGLKRDEFIEKCQGLCKNHQGDGSRYRSIPQRRTELGRMWDYMHSNPAYEFSGGAIRALVDGPAPDLTLGETTNPDGSSDLAITLGLSINRNGIYKMTDEGFPLRISPVGAANPAYLWSLDTGDFMGYAVDLFANGVPCGRHTLTMDVFSSRQRFTGFMSRIVNESCQVTDGQVNALISIFKRMAQQSEGGIVYVVSHEGLDIVTLPDTRERDIIWVERDRVLSKLGKSYVFVNGIYGGMDHPYKVDLLLAPHLIPVSGQRCEGVDYLTPRHMEALRQDLHHLLRINHTQAIAKALGWVVACFLCPALRLTHDRQFPLLHLYGTMHSGKSTTMRLMAGLHSHNRPLDLVIAGSSTPAPITSKAVGTTSIPFIVDEYKPMEMRGNQLDTLTMMFRAVWDCGAAMRGRVSREKGDSQVVTQELAQSAPTAMLSEFREQDAAILNRAIVVPFDTQDQALFSEHVLALTQDRQENLFGSLGREIVDYLIFSDKASPEAIHAKLVEYKNQLAPIIKGDASDRPRYAIAVAATGLHFFKEVLALFFDAEFSGRIDELLEALLAPPLEKAATLVTATRPALAQVLGILSELSHRQGVTDDHCLVYGVDYGVGPDYVELNARRSYFKYALRAKTVGDRRLFLGADAFIAALDLYKGASKVIDSPLGTQTVYRLDTQQMYETDHIEPFADK
jgi:energy-coupling factor transporter ATP-binding protein EcfA2